MDGSEPGESVPAAVLSGAPVDLQARTVRYDTRASWSRCTIVNVRLTELASTNPQRRPPSLATGPLHTG